MERKNSIGNLLNIIAYIIYVAGFMGGIFAAYELEYTGLEIVGFLTYSISGFVVGTLFLGFSEVIFILDRLDLNIRKDNIYENKPDSYRNKSNTRNELKDDNDNILTKF